MLSLWSDSNENLQEAYGSCWKPNYRKTQLFQKKRKVVELPVLLMSNNAQSWHSRDTKPQAELSVLFWTHRRCAELSILEKHDSANSWKNTPFEPPKEVILFDRKAAGQGKSSTFPYNGQFKAVFFQGGQFALEHLREQL